MLGISGDEDKGEESGGLQLQNEEDTDYADTEASERGGDKWKGEGGKPTERSPETSHDTSLRSPTNFVSPELSEQASEAEGGPETETQPGEPPLGEPEPKGSDGAVQVPAVGENQVDSGGILSRLLGLSSTC